MPATSARKRGPIADHGQSLVTEAREREGLSVQDLADRLGVTRDAVYQLERRGDRASLAQLRAAVEACGLRLVVSVRG